MERKKKTKELSSIEGLKKSVNTMVDCVNYLEKIRSYDYLGSIEDSDLQKVLSQMKEIEERLENINKNKADKKIFKAIGKNRTVWVTKPATPFSNEEKPVSNNDNGTKMKHSKNIINKDEINKLFKKSRSSETMTPEKNIKTKLLAVKYNLTNFF